MRATTLLLVGIQLVLGTTALDVNPICETTTDTLIAHKTKCSHYYNCSAPARLGEHWEANLQECDYPQVYNPDTRRCEHYTMVDCGEREMPLGICDYTYTNCLRAHCRPCSSAVPSCRYLEDGLHGHPIWPDPSQFIVCSEHRLVYEGTCASIPDGYMIFDPERRTCVEVPYK